MGRSRSQSKVSRVYTNRLVVSTPAWPLRRLLPLCGQPGGMVGGPAGRERQPVVGLCGGDCRRRGIVLPFVPVRTDRRHPRGAGGVLVPVSVAQVADDLDVPDPRPAALPLRARFAQGRGRLANAPLGTVPAQDQLGRDAHHAGRGVRAQRRPDTPAQGLQLSTKPVFVHGGPAPPVSRRSRRPARRWSWPGAPARPGPSRP